MSATNNQAKEKIKQRENTSVSSSVPFRSVFMQFNLYFSRKTWANKQMLLLH